MNAKTLIDWLETLDAEESVFIHEGGITLMTTSGAYLEVGGGPEEETEAPISSALFNNFEIEIPEEALDVYPRQGECGPWVDVWKSKITRPTLCTPEKLAAELKEYGAWDAAELAEDGKNWERILWLSGGQILDERAKEERQS